VNALPFEALEMGERLAFEGLHGGTVSHLEMRPPQGRISTLPSMAGSRTHRIEVVEGKSYSRFPRPSGGVNRCCGAIGSLMGVFCLPNLNAAEQPLLAGASWRKCPKSATSMDKPLLHGGLKELRNKDFLRYSGPTGWT
jgi:hypothetical protein